jgi:mono/diheme cytochrome c family protein
MEDKMAGNTLMELWERLGRHPGSRGKWTQILPIAKTLKSILLAIAILVVFSLDPVQAEDPLPKGEGRNLVSKKCQRCHGLDRIQEMRGSREQWSEILDEMTNNGLVLNDKNTKVVLNYLETHLGLSPKK